MDFSVEFVKGKFWWLWKLCCRLEGEHVVLGKVIQGMDNVFAIEGGAGTYSGKPRKKVVIADSGEIPKDKWDEERWQRQT